MGHGFHGYVKLPWLGQGLVAARPTLSCVVDFQFLAEEVCHNKMPAHSKVHWVTIQWVGSMIFFLNQSIEQW